MTPNEFIADGFASVRALTDEGDQLHRRAAQGRRLEVFEHERDHFGAGGRGVSRVSLRLEGQSLNRVTTPIERASEAGSFAEQCRALLRDMPPPIPGDVHTPRRGRPPTPEPLKRVDVPLRLQQWLRDEVREIGPPADVIEAALIGWYKLRPPKA